MANQKQKLRQDEIDGFLLVLERRFQKNAEYHEGLDWTDVKKKLIADPGKLVLLYGMEETGGEPDVIGFEKKSGEYIFCDCSAESPKDRRSLCYDKAALDSRKQNKPADSAVNMAENMGISLLSEEDYRKLQSLGPFDLKTSSWLKTPPEIRKLGGAIFGDRRYDHVFIYHNGADSYYSARGFRGILKI